MSAATSVGIPAIGTAVRRQVDPLRERPKITLRPVPFAAFLLLALGFLLVTEVHLIGTLFAGEVLLIPVALLTLAAGFGRFDKELWKFVGLYCFTLAVYVAADLINGTAMNDAVRGWARVGFVIVAVLAIHPMLKKSRFNLFPIAVGMTIGHIVLKLIFKIGVDELFPKGLRLPEFWKWYLSTICVASGLYLIGWFSKHRAFVHSVLFLCVVAVVSVRFDARAGPALCLVVAGIIAAKLVAVQRIKRLFPVLLAAGMIFAGLSSWILLQRTNDEFSRRRSGSNAARLAALYTAVQTIAEHPVLGVGSWSEQAEAADRHRQAAEDLGQLYDTETAVQSGHSTILQAAAEAGIFAALAFIYYFWRLLISAIWMLRKPLDRLYAAELFLLLNGIWNCLFSPFNGGMRLYIAINTCLCIFLAEEKKLFNRDDARRRQILRQTELDRIHGGLGAERQAVSGSPAFRTYSSIGE